jgi:hypothetical protein
MESRKHFGRKLFMFHLVMFGFSLLNPTFKKLVAVTSTAVPMELS